MKKKILSLMLTLGLCLGLTVPALAASTTYIYTVDDLLQLSLHRTANAVLMADLDLSGVSSLPLGDFNGTFDGNGHTLSHAEYPLFRSLESNGTIKNLTMADINSQQSAGLVYTSSGLLENCTVTGKLHTTNIMNVGGLAGVVTAGSRSRVVGCRTDIEITADYTEEGLALPGSIPYYFVGGVIGKVSSDSSGLIIIDRCQCDGDITINTPQAYCSLHVGGVVATSDGTLKNCGNTGTLTLNAYPYGGGSLLIGEILGHAAPRPLEGAFVENCWGTGDIYINAPELAGRVWLTLAGDENCWADCTVTGGYYDNQSAVGGPGTYLPADTALAYGRGTPLFTRKELTDGTLVSKLNAYVAAHPNEGLMAWTQGPNGPVLTDSSVIPSTPAPAPSQAAFSDVAAGAYYAEPVAWAVEQGITNGTGNGKFSPDATCTQAQILTFLWRALGEPAPKEPAGSTLFYAPAAQWADDLGLIDLSRTFSAGADCTRAMVVLYLWRLAGSPDVGTPDFTDVSVSSYYAQAVAWAVQQNITNGTGGGKFSPDATCTRGQIVTFLYRAFAE